MVRSGSSLSLPRLDRGDEDFVRWLNDTSMPESGELEPGVLVGIVFAADGGLG